MSWFTDHFDPSRGWELAMADARTDLPINFAANRQLMADLRARPHPDLSRLDMPCHFVIGAGDPRPGWAVADLAAAIPGAGLHVVEDAGHHPWREQPGPFAALLRRLISTSTYRA